MLSLAILVPLLSALMGAVATSISKHIVAAVNPQRLTTLTFAAVVLVMAPFAPWFFQLSSLTVVVPVLVAISLFDAVANLLFFTALEMDQVSRVTALAATSPLWTAILSSAVFPSQAGPVAFVATCAIVLGVYLIETDAGVRFRDQFLRKETYYVVVSAFVFGATTIPMRLLMTEWGLINAPTLYWLRAMIIAGVLFALLRPAVRELEGRLHGIIIVKAVFVSLQWTLMLYAVSQFNVVLSKALSQTVPVFVAVIAWSVLDEPLTPRNIAAIGLIVSVVVLLQTGFLL